MRTRDLLRRRAGRLLLAALLWPTTACSPGPTEPGAGPRGEGRRILFVGNSLTYYNDLPDIVRALAAASGGEPLAVASATYPNVSLEDHWGGGAARGMIAGGEWSVVVLQQGPSSLPESRVLLRDYAARFATEIRAVGARPALYAVWPTSDRAQDFERAGESYALAAADVNGLLFPVGEAWRAAWRRDPTLPLYAGDGLHPSRTGSYLAAIVIYAVLAERSPVGLPASVRVSGGTIGVTPEMAAVLQAAAAEAIAAARP